LAAMLFVSCWELVGDTRIQIPRGLSTPQVI
jgi:hypothetical protein